MHAHTHANTESHTHALNCSIQYLTVLLGKLVYNFLSMNECIPTDNNRIALGASDK